MDASRLIAFLFITLVPGGDFRIYQSATTVFAHKLGKCCWHVLPATRLGCILASRGRTCHTVLCVPAPGTLRGGGGKSSVQCAEEAALEGAAAKSGANRSWAPPAEHAAETEQWVSVSGDPWESAPDVLDTDREHGFGATCDEIRSDKGPPMDIPAAAGSVSELLAFLSHGQTRSEHLGREGREETALGGAVSVRGDDLRVSRASSVDHATGGGVGQEHDVGLPEARSTVQQASASTEADASVPPRPPSSPGRGGWIPDFDELDLPEPAPQLSQPGTEATSLVVGAASAPSDASALIARDLPQQSPTKGSKPRAGAMVLRSADGRVLPKDVMGEPSTFCPSLLATNNKGGFNVLVMGEPSTFCPSLLATNKKGGFDVLVMGEP